MILKNKLKNIDKSMNKLQKLRMFMRSVLSQFGEVVTDKGLLNWDGNEDLKEGMQVFIRDVESEDLEYETAPAGNYTTEDGKIITVNVEGKVESIEDPKAEVAEEKVEEMAEEKTEEMAEEVKEEVENPTNEGEETDTEAIVELRREVNELYARVNAMEDMLRKLSETPAAMSAVEQVAPQVDNTKSRLAYLREIK